MMPGTGIFSPKCAMSPFSPVSLFPLLFIFLFFSYPRPLRRKRRGENVPPIILCFFPLFFLSPPLPPRFLSPLFTLFFGSPSVSLGKIYKSSVRARERQDHSSAGRLVGGNGFVAAEVAAPRKGGGREGGSAAEAVSGERCSFASHMQ